MGRRSACVPDRPGQGETARAQDRAKQTDAMARPGRRDLIAATTDDDRGRCNIKGLNSSARAPFCSPVRSLAANGYIFSSRATSVKAYCFHLLILSFLQEDLTLHAALNNVFQQRSREGSHRVS